MNGVRHASRRAGTLAKVAAEFATPFTRLVGCRAPIQLAVMGGGTGTPELAAAVSQAGGLGMLSSTFPMPVDEQLSWVQDRFKISQLTACPSWAT